MRLPILVLLLPLLAPLTVNAADVPRDPTAILNKLADRLYVIGETTADVAAMVAAEAQAAEEISAYIASGATAGLLPKDKGKQGPLGVAAYMGYPNVVAALLRSELVRSHIDDADDMGLTPWGRANFSMRQTIWTCRPAIFEDPFKLVPLLVTQGYYLSNPTPPYLKTRTLLEDAGAKVDVAAAKAVWLAACKTESAEAEIKVRASADLLRTVQDLAAVDLDVQMRALRKRAADAKKE